jgi:hypothetical protein
MDGGAALDEDGATDVDSKDGTDKGTVGVVSIFMSLVGKQLSLSLAF